MKNNLLIITFLPLVLVSCNENISSSSYLVNSFISSSVESLSSISSSNVRTQKEIVEDFKDDLLKINYQVSSSSYVTNQEDYYGISVELSEEGEIRLYQDNFIVKEFEQTIGEDKVEGRSESGINDDKIYQITYYGEQDDNNSVKYYLDNDYNRKVIFDIGFINEYVNNILDVTLNYLENVKYKVSLVTNFDQIDLESDGEKSLQFRLISYAPNGIDKIEEVQRDDILVIQNRKILSSKTTMIYSLQDGVNYKYMEKNTFYHYESLETYNGVRINPTTI